MVQNSGSQISARGLGVFIIQRLGNMVWGLGLRVKGLGLRVQGFDYRAEGFTRLAATSAVTSPPPAAGTVGTWGGSSFFSFWAFGFRGLECRLGVYKLETQLDS